MHRNRRNYKKNIEGITKKNLHQPHYSERLIVFMGAWPEDADVSAVDLLKRPRVLLHVLQQVKKKRSSSVKRWFILLLTIRFEQFFKKKLDSSHV